METTFTIGRLARAAGVPVSTLRYYERRGLLCPELRAPSSYRIYTAAQLGRLRFIKAAQANGFTLEDIRSLLELRGRADEACPDVRDLVSRRLCEVRARLEDLHRVEQVLESTLQGCDESAEPVRCPAMDDLEARVGTPRDEREH